jgi:hypothetical protein
MFARCVLAIGRTSSYASDVANRKDVLMDGFIMLICEDQCEALVG